MSDTGTNSTDDLPSSVKFSVGDRVKFDLTTIDSAYGEVIGTFGDSCQIMLDDGSFMVKDISELEMDKPPMFTRQMVDNAIDRNAVRVEGMDNPPETMMTRHNILAEASSIVSYDRNTDYGNPEDNFRDIAQMWSAYKGVDFTAADVAAMMVLLKVSRVKTSPGKRDHWVDIAGYASCGGQAYDATHR